MWMFHNCIVLFRYFWMCLFHFLSIVHFSLLSLSWILASHVSLASTLKPAPASSRHYGSTSRPTSCRILMKRSTSTVINISSRHWHTSVIYIYIRYAIRQKVNTKMNMIYIYPSPPDLRLSSSKVLWDPSATNQPAAAAWSYCDQSCYQVISHKISVFTFTFLRPVTWMHFFEGCFPLEFKGIIHPKKIK